MSDNHDTTQPAAAQQAFPDAVGGPRDQRPLSPQEERTWAMATHAVPMVAWLFSAGLLGFVASLVIYLLHRDKSPFLRQHAVNSLNAQLSGLLYMVLSGILAVVGVLLLIFVVGVVPLVLGVLGILATAALLLWIHVNGAVKAWDGKAYAPPLTIRFLR